MFLPTQAGRQHENKKLNKINMLYVVVFVGVFISI